MGYTQRRAKIIRDPSEQICDLLKGDAIEQAHLLATAAIQHLKEEMGAGIIRSIELLPAACRIYCSKPLRSIFQLY